MADPVTALVAGGTQLVGGLLGADSKKSAAKSASGAQVAAAKMGIEEQRRQFDAITELLSPYVKAGEGAITAQQGLLGLDGKGAQSQAVSNIEQSPMFQAIQKQGEQSILQNAAATGGIRGGNVQGALAQFSPQLLNQQVQQQLQNLGGLTNVGQASAARQAAAGQQTGANVSNLMGQIGSAQAGSQLAQGQANANLFGDISSGIGSAAVLHGLGVF